jgi:hypothetical protein
MSLILKSMRFIFSAEPLLFERVDEWRHRQPDVPSRAEAIRQLVEIGLAEAGL